MYTDYPSGPLWRIGLSFFVGILLAGWILPSPVSNEFSQTFPDIGDDYAGFPEALAVGAFLYIVFAVGLPAHRFRMLPVKGMLCCLGFLFLGGGRYLLQKSLWFDAHLDAAWEKDQRSLHCLTIVRLEDHGRE